jgi:hypothetical protein
MMCIRPISIKNKQGTFTAVPCGLCYACLMNKRADWTFRLKQEYKNSLSGFFLTMTYDDLHIKTVSFTKKNGVTVEVQILDKVDVQKFLKRLRKRLNNKIRYFAVGEYGDTTFRPHYHMLLFNININDLKYVEESWNDGFVRIDPINDARIHYVSKYAMKYHKHKHFAVKPFSLMSKGIGKSYIEHNIDMHRKSKMTYVLDNGFKHKMPRYYRDKIFTNPWEKQKIYEENQETALRLQRKKEEVLFREHSYPFQYEMDVIKHFENKINKDLKKDEL